MIDSPEYPLFNPNLPALAIGTVAGPMPRLAALEALVAATATAASTSATTAAAGASATAGTTVSASAPSTTTLLRVTLWAVACPMPSLAALEAIGTSSTATSASAATATTTTNTHLSRRSRGVASFWSLGLRALVVWILSEKRLHQLVCLGFVRRLVLVSELVPLRLEQRVDLLDRRALVGLLDLSALVVAKELEGAQGWLRCHWALGGESFSPSSVLGRLGLGLLAIGCLLLEPRLLLLRILPKQCAWRRQ